MYSKSDLAHTALAKALEMRLKLGKALWEPLCIYDLAAELGVGVWFADIPSLEGMYCKERGKPRIIISSLRPSGRQAYTCAHEVGHHVFGHGTRVDDNHALELAQSRDPHERLADLFAGYLLMPKVSVTRAFASRNLIPQTSSPEEVYKVATFLGVGYSTLVQHLYRSLSLLSETRAQQLSKASPKLIRAGLVGAETEEDVHFVDKCWAGRPVDVEVGDLIFAPRGFDHEGQCLRVLHGHVNEQVLQAIEPGIGRLYSETDTWAGFVRVRRREYAGRAEYRHLEDPDYVH